MSDEEIDLGFDDFDVVLSSESDDLLEGGNPNNITKTSDLKNNKTKKNKDEEDDEDEDEDEDDDDEDDDENINDGGIVEEDPGLITENMLLKNNKIINTQFRGIYDPVKYKALENSKMEERMVVPPTMKRTSHKLTLAEKTNLIGIRATHIEQGSPIFVDYEGLTSAIDIASEELKKRRFPLLLERHINPYEVEFWDPNEMTIDW